MRGKSHISLGQDLLRRYLPDLSTAQKQAFLLGCIQPDRNPATYLKGSLRHQWLRGHNYRNASRFMDRVSLRLERKSRWNLWDYYTLGKLIHYTADAFTFAHNHTFPERLSSHLAYEIRLQPHFLSYLQSDPVVELPPAGSVMTAIGSCHREYAREKTDFRRDSRFALQACCGVLAVLLAPRL